MSDTATASRAAHTLVFAPSGGPGPAITSLENLELREISGLAEVEADHDRTAVLVFSDELVDGDTPAALRDLPAHVVVLGMGREATGLASDANRLFLSLDEDTSREGVTQAVRAAASHSGVLLEGGRTTSELGRMRTELEELNKIGMALMSERNPDNLLSLILTQARRVTTSDAGSLYLVEDAEDGGSHLHFRMAQNDSLPDLPTPDFTLSLDRSSVAGYAASTGEPLVIDDAYEIPDSAPYSFNTGFDEEFGYRARSMLVVPMMDHQDRVVGVLQLINRKRSEEASIHTEEDADEHVLRYSERDVSTVQSLAGQAAVSIENSQLYQDIENLFEGFITAAVTAIDQRDPTTSGHSVRVTELTCDMAEVMHRKTDGPFADVRFSRDEMKQLRYAGLLHDFGKVGVREEVLVKERKLPPVMESRVEARFDLIRQSLEAELLDRKVAYLQENGQEGYAGFAEAVTEEFQARLERVNEYHEAIKEANLPRVLPEESAEILEEIAEETFVNPEGEEEPYLTQDELHYLKIPRGNLDEHERAQIQSHVEHSYSFLQEIPWTDDLSRIDEIVLGHHEKLDGSGYPRGVSGEEIPLETRIMTVADIFDALTASDRPYKKAMPVEKALSILRMEAEGGQLDPEIVELFVESEVYRKVLETDWRELAGL